FPEHEIALAEHMVRAGALRVGADCFGQRVESLFILLCVKVSNRQVYQDLLRVRPVKSGELKRRNGLLIIFLSRIYFSELAISLGQNSLVFSFRYDKISRTSLRFRCFRMLTKHILG